MIFESLYESAKEGELILVDGGYCRYHLRKDGQLTIYEIITTIKGSGVGIFMLERLKAVRGARYILAKCPLDLNANHWYADQGFKILIEETTRSGRKLNVWVLNLE